MPPAPNPRIHHPIQHIHHQVHPDKGQRRDQDAGLHHGVVAPRDGVDQPFADAGPAEDGFGQHRAGQQAAGLQAHHGQHRDQCVAQRVHDHDPRRRQALGARGAHIVLAQHFQHGRARHARHHRQRARAQHQRRQHEVQQRRLEGAFFAAQPGVDQHEAGHALWVELDADAAAHRRPAQLHAEEHDEDQPPPEHRHRVTHRRQAHHALVQQRAALQPGAHAQQQAQAHRKDQRRRGQLHRRREEGGELVAHRLAAHQALAQVAVQQLRHIVQVLHRQRLVQAHALDQRGMGLGVQPALAHHHFDRVAGHEADQTEGDDRDADQRRHQRGQAFEHEAQHHQREV
mmetsp:Transcript_59387/g.140251  ORF Transcript_59387/g.140251 Transcript_59387/m.140251 type:complete len:343 (-) Transcript_59387:286-1314(-)